MQARVFREEDLKAMNQWLEDRHVGAITKEVLPMTGFIVEGVACGFLYTTDSKVGLLDFYVSNPKAKTEDRAAALDEITRCLIENATLRGFWVLMGSSDKRSIKERCKRFGFLPLGQQEAFILEIKT